MGILEQIIIEKERELIVSKQETTIEMLEKLINLRSVPLNFVGSLMGNGIRIIAEIKKASPSKGILKNDFHPIKIAESYCQNGAAAISVLTDKRFMGNLEYLLAIKQNEVTAKIPLLRKDFIFDKYQIYESRAYGADAVLLIASILSILELKTLIDLVHEFRMQAIVEIHNKEELNSAIEAGAEIIGINNRDLRTFKTDLKTTEFLVPFIPEYKIIVSESGINSNKDIKFLKNLGVNAFLIGESLMKMEDPGSKLKEFLHDNVEN